MLGRTVAERLSPAVWSTGLAETCRACDAVVINLECCISARGSRTELVPDKPFFFRSPPAAVEVLRAIGVRVAGVANNHALDFGRDAFVDTLAHLREAGIACPGGGLRTEAARRGVLARAGGLTLGVLALSDHPLEFAARPDEPGIAFADLRHELPGWVSAELERLRRDADVVLAFPHWGPNMSERPAPWQRHRAAELLAAGADAVAGHSAHVFHGVEGAVVYDLGGALDDYAVDDELRNDLGLLALWRPDAAPSLELVGLRLDFCRTGIATGADADWIAARLASACGELGTSVERTEEARFLVLD